MKLLNCVCLYRQIFLLKPDVVITPGTCSRVSTGGVIPEGANAVVQVEDTCVHSRNEVMYHYEHLMKSLISLS